ncbi:MAG: hypothetical protein CSB13_04435 [Chloroflexi bacterium]|nr:MAG: hypothetical protein CSB13_04435 [Chloroflexota bacterium]
MDSFFGIGIAELLVILFLAGIVMGPKRIRQVAFWLGKVTAKLQATSREFNRQLNAELSAIDEDGDIKEAWGEVQDLRKQLADLRSEIASVAAQPLAEGQKVMEEARDTVDNTIHLPNFGSENRISKENAVQSFTEQEQLDQNGGASVLPNLVEVEDDPE